MHPSPLVNGLISMNLVQEDEDQREAISLPPFERISDENETGASAMYGAAALAAAYSGFKTVPSRIRASWMHGWYPRFRQKLHPDFFFGIRTIPDGVYLVSRKDEE